MCSVHETLEKCVVESLMVMSLKYLAKDRVCILIINFACPFHKLICRKSAFSILS